MARPEDSDLRTFKSNLRQEAQPDFTLIVGDFSWTVHTTKLLKSSFFQKLCDGVGFQRSVTLDEDEPIVIGHLILWLYTGAYTDDGEVSKGIDINTIMQSGKANNIKPPMSPELGSAASPSSLFVPEEETWPIPPAIHAKMYMLAEKYGIGELATLSIDELNNEVGWNDAIFLPSLEYLFTARDSCNDSSSYAASTAVPVPTKDAEMFEFLANTASAFPAIQAHLINPTFQKVLRENPSFTFEVLTRVTAELQETKDECAKLNETIETPKVKKGRKKRVASASLEKEGG